MRQILFRNVDCPVINVRVVSHINVAAKAGRGVEYIASALCAFHVSFDAIAETPVVVGSSHHFHYKSKRLVVSAPGAISRGVRAHVRSRQRLALRRLAATFDGTQGTQNPPTRCKDMGEQQARTNRVVFVTESLVGSTRLYRGHPGHTRAVVRLAD